MFQLSDLCVAEPGGTYRAVTADEVIGVAESVMQAKVVTGPMFSSPQVVKDLIRFWIGGYDHEVFALLFVDCNHRVIARETMFHGTLTQTSVYPREVVKRALHHNAAAVILTHNHPSGQTTPSRADEMLTTKLKSALSLVDVQVLDHIIVSPTGATSMAEEGFF